jgi:hypothetical protein
VARYEQRKVGVWDNDTSTHVTRLSGDAWREYMAWVAAGNTPDPQPPDPPLPDPTPEELAARAELISRRQMRDAMRADGTIAFIRTHTPAEVEAWVNTNVTDLASAKNVLSKVAMIVAYLARERLAGE